MGLVLSVGYLAEMKELEEAAEGVASFRRQLDRLNAFLRKKGLPEHVEPEGQLPIRHRGQLNSFPYSGTHHLRRAVAYARRAPEEFATIDRKKDPARDYYVDAVSCDFDCHLICHSDCEGYYVPIDFPDPLFSDKEDGIPGCMVGSSQRLLAELVQAAPLLGITLDADGRLSDAEAATLGELDDHKYERERAFWFAYYVVAQVSVDHKSLVVLH